MTSCNWGCLGALPWNPLLLGSLKEVVCSEPSRNGSCAYVFFSQISWHVPTFQICAANLSKPITDTDIMFPLKVARFLGLHFRWKKNWKKFGFIVSFKKKFWKNATFDCFSCLIPYFSEPGPNTRCIVSGNLQAFHRLRFRPKIASNFFQTWFFLQKRDEKKCRNFFSHL